MRRRTSFAMLACAVLIGLAGCGGSGDKDSSSDTVTTESTPTETETAPRTATTPAQTVTTPPVQTVTTPPSSGSGGGATVPADPSKPDGPANDTKPPAGSPAEKFEQQCQANPQTCGD